MESSKLKCPVCEGSPISRIRRIKETIIYKCSSCTFAFCWPLPHHSSLSSGPFSVATGEYYTESYISNSRKLQPLYKQLAHNRYGYYSEKLKLVKFDMLEIGAGIAGLASAFEEKGVNYEGLELDPRLVTEVKRNASVNIKQIDFMDFEPKKKYHCIFSSQVLEHITKPALFMDKIWRFLHPNGIVHIDVPNHYSLSGYIYGFIHSPVRYGAIRWPDHLFGYSAISLNKLMYRFDACVFNATSDDAVWGQAHAASLRGKLYHSLASLCGLESLTVALGVKRE